MGYALIVGGGTDGRYTIELDIGEDERAALVARFTAQNVEAQEKLVIAEAELAQKKDKLDEAAAAYQAATDEYILLLRGELPGITEEEGIQIVNDYTTTQVAHTKALAEHNTALSNRNAVSFNAKHLEKALAAWQALVLTESRDAWCADLTEDAIGYVKTLEIPGESDLILIAPGGTYPSLETAGYLRSRALMSPWQAFFNAAVLPGWQKFKPTYRFGTITALDEDANTATVELAVARSSAQQLPVNKSNTLTNIPVVYMDCNAAAFDVGDRAVVEFQGQDWSAPRVIGFVDNPRGCGWPCVGTTPYNGPWFVTSSQVLVDKMMDPGTLFEWKTDYANTWSDLSVPHVNPLIAIDEVPFEKYVPGMERGALRYFDYGRPNVDPNNSGGMGYFWAQIRTKAYWDAASIAIPSGVKAIVTVDNLYYYHRPDDEHIGELRVTLNGELLCNIAVGRTPAEGVATKARTLGGITNTFGSPVSNLDGYTLYSEL